MAEVIIIGAGLSGLSAAYYLKQQGIESLLLEARPRWGGRILTLAAEGQGTPLEMGATWFADKHTNLLQLLKELDLPYFRQYQKGIGVFDTHPSEEIQFYQMPDAGEASYRLQGGTATLTEALVQAVGRDQIIINAPVSAVTEMAGGFEATTREEEKYNSKFVVCTLPPFLIRAQNIAFTPPLPQEVVRVMENTHTWMGESVKFGVEYPSAFWRAKGYSGAAFSNYGIIQEMHDHCNFDESRFALKGFLKEDAFSLPQEERKTQVLRQLIRMFGQEADQYLSYTDLVWKEEPYTFASYGKYLLPHQNNGHPVYRHSLLEGKLVLAGSETSPQYGGYMDGAVYSGYAAALHIAQKVKRG